MILERRAATAVRQALDHQAAVVLLGPRQVGKTTLALALAEERPSLYLDLERPADREKLREPELYLGAYRDRLVILDEIHRTPEIFSALRGLIDAGRRAGRRRGLFLLLGSASMELLRQTGESLAGRVAHVELAPLDVREIGAAAEEVLWLRGGFPDSFLADGDRASLDWREDFIRTYLERDVPQLGPRIPAETLRRFWTMLAHVQGAPLNASRLAAGLGVKGQTVAGYVDLLVDLLLVRRLMPWHANTGKRLVKTPKVFVRDSGIAHALLRIGDREALLGHPVAGPSWEGFAIETLLDAAPPRTSASYYRAAGGAEIDLVLEFPNRSVWAVEIKRSLAPKLERGFHHARADLEPARSFVVYPGRERYPIAEGIEAVGLRDLAETLGSM
jgi:predicted AAA+ superfamily ATPase